MSDYYEDPLDEIYRNDPAGATRAVIEAAAAQAAAELAHQNDARREAELARIQMHQSESASITAQDALIAKYGKAEYERLQPRMAAKLQEHPNLVPYESLTSPSALANSLDQVAKLARLEADEEDKARHWETVKGSHTNIFVGWGKLGPRGDQ